MTAYNLKPYYSRFLAGHKGSLHFAAHSHHFWPDVTREAHLQYWDDCALLSDEKWTKIFSEVIPKTQKHVANILNLSQPEQITFAPNTHELLTRILSLFLGKSELSILTTSSEFHSWRRQLQRINELSGVHVTTVSTEKIRSKREIFLSQLKLELQKRPDLFFISQVFFDSGIALTDEELLDLNEACPSETIMVIDGYHGFGAIPTNLSQLEGKVFYLGGGYKYAQAGEGVGFIVVPKGPWRPAYTGWFAEFGDLSKPRDKEVGYTNDGLAFIGATQDPSGLYRMNAAWDLFERMGLKVSVIHDYIKNLQSLFIKEMPLDFIKSHELTPLIPEDLSWHGHFLTYEAPTEEKAAHVEERLKMANILIDRRGKRLRFGFGLYLDETDIHSLVNSLKDLA
jgi:selenocysteine lyase/cysteine desulfurase